MSSSSQSVLDMETSLPLTDSLPDLFTDTGVSSGVINARLRSSGGWKAYRATDQSDGAAISFLGVDYWRYQTADGGELYLTQFGLPFRHQLDPENWHASGWFATRGQRLPGTSVIYKTRTKPVQGSAIDLIVRFSRVGQPVPLETFTLCQYPHAEFNSPFEEFSLVMELRAAQRGLQRTHLFTKKPLAVFVPHEQLQPWQTGRCESKIAAKRARHPEVPIDMRRHYVLLYGWVNGQDAVQTAQLLGLSGESRASFLTRITQGAIEDLKQHGFRMLDIKPQHLVLRLRSDGSLVSHHDGRPVCALVDYELLERI